MWNLKSISYRLLIVILFIPSLISCRGKGTLTPSPTPTSTARPSVTITPSATLAISPKTSQTPTPYQAVLRHTPLPGIQLPITSENAHQIVQLAKWWTRAKHGNEIDFTPDGKSLLIGIESLGVQVWDIASGSEVHTLLGNGGITTTLAIAPDGTYVAFGNSPLSIGKIPEYKLVDLIPDYNENFATKILLFSPNSQILVGGDDLGDIEIYDFVSNNIYSRSAHEDALELGLKWNTNNFIDLEFRPDGEFLISGSRDGLLKIWRTSDYYQERNIDMKHPISNLAISPDGSILAVGCADINRVQLLEVSTLKVLASLDHPNSINEVRFSHNGSILATACSDNQIYLWNPRSGEELTTLSGSVRAVFDVAFSPDDKILASMGNEGTVRLWGILAPLNSIDYYASATASANSITTSTSTPPAFPPEPTSVLPSYSGTLPFNFPIPPINKEQLSKQNACNIESIKNQHYPESVRSSELETVYEPQSACDWAALSAAYLDRLNYNDPIPEQGKRAFIQTILLNPAFLFSKNLFYGYYDSFNLVDPIPISEKEINAVHIDYQWSGIGDPSDVSYQIDINKSDSDPLSMNVSAISPSGRITSTLETTIDRKFIQNLIPSLTDFVPIEQQFSLNYCYDNSPDWQVTLSFQDGSHIDLQTNGSNLPNVGGPWQTMIDGQNYLQYSFALPRFIFALFEQLGLPLGEPWAMSCFGIPVIDLAFP